MTLHKSVKECCGHHTRFYGYEQLPEIEDPVGLLKNQLQNPNDYGYTLIACEKEKIIGATILTSIEEQAKRINLLVFEKNRAAVNLYRKMGFCQISIPGLDEQLEEEVQGGNSRRIIMSRPAHSSFKGYIGKSAYRHQAHERDSGK